MDAIHRSRGRVIVTGMGKSGHIGQKIAATLASTGTPAFFVHPGEASHGDLGMITRDDVILALSWSGETVELATSSPFRGASASSLIAITSRDDSALGKASDVVLQLPHSQEACPHGLAPTTSTAMQLAAGDCLAVALLEARGFSAADFKVFHPGGQLGANLNYVADLMHKRDELAAGAGRDADGGRARHHDGAELRLPGRRGRGRPARRHRHRWRSAPSHGAGSARTPRSATS